MQIRFNHFVYIDIYRFRCLFIEIKIIEIEIIPRIRNRFRLKFEEKLIQFLPFFEFGFMLVRTLVKNYARFFFPPFHPRERAILYAVIIPCFDSGGYYVSSSTATFGNRFCIKDESESAIRGSRLDCSAVMRTRGKMVKSIST